MKTFKYIKYISFAVVLSILAAGCKKDTKKPIDTRGTKLIQSSPAGASIIYNGNELGKTPYTVKAKPNFYVVKLIKHGFRPRYAYFNITSGKNSPETYKLEPASASALVESNPAGAYVTFNGNRIGETPCVLPDLPFGNHSIHLEKSGYAPKDMTFAVNSDRPLKISTSLESNIGNITITSEPSGAKVLLNGEQIGITPLKREYPDGEYKLTLQHANHLDLNTSIAIRKGSDVKRSYKLTLLPGSFKIITNPAGAKISLGGKFIGNSPVTITDQLANQDHHLVIQLAGFASQKHKIRTTPGKEETFTYNLKRNRGDLEFVINPPGVTVYIDGEKYGVTEKADTSKTSKLITIKNMTPGTHTIRYTHRRAVPSSKTKRVEVIAGETTRIAPMSLWVPTAEIIYKDDSKESVIILSEDGRGIYVEPLNGIRYTVLRSKIQKINYFKDTE